MSTLTIEKEPCELDLLSLGALIHRLDPGNIPFRKATQRQIHVSGGEFNVAANLADCFRLQTGIATAMVDYPIGDLIAERVRAMGVRPFYKRFAHDGVTGPNMATVYSDRGLWRARRRWSSTTAPTRPAALLKPGDFDWRAIFAARRPLVPQRRHLRGAFPDHVGNRHRRHGGRQGRRRGGLLRPELSREALGHLRRRRPRPARSCAASSRTVDVLVGNEEDLQKGLGFAGPEVARHARSSTPAAFFELIEQVLQKHPQHQAGSHDASRRACGQSPRLGRRDVVRRAAIRHAHDATGRALPDRRRRRLCGRADSTECWPAASPRMPCGWAGRTARC